jgi:diguanylate cyclase (GGDEF)-like protein
VSALSARRSIQPQGRGADAQAGELELILRGFGHSVGAEAAVLCTGVRAQRSAGILASWDSETSRGAPSAWAGGLRDHVLATGETVVALLGPGGDPALRAATEVGLVRGVAAAVALPRSRTAVLCAGFASPPPADFEPTLRLTESWAALASLCLHDSRLIDGLLAATGNDELTGCLNYSGMRRAMSAEIVRAERHGLSLCCCFIDLDDFKRVNDRHGHPHGNRVLAEVAGALRRGMRTSDILARYGGDEFVAILPHTDAAAACRVADRLRREVGEIDSNCGEPLQSSIGVAQWRPGLDVDQLLAEADRTLLAAKRGPEGALTADAQRVEANLGVIQPADRTALTPSKTSRAGRHEANVV